MTMLEELDNAIENYFSEIIVTKNFVLYEEYAKGMGALKKYKNDFIKIQVLNDRGIINLNISAIFDKEDFRDTEIINSMFELEKSSSKVIGKWDREKIINKCLDLKEQANVIKDNWDNLVKLYDANNYRHTINLIDKLGIERSKILFG